VLLFEVARYLKLAAVGDGLRASGETGCRSASDNRRSAWPTQVFAGRTRSVCVGGKLLGVASRSPEQSGRPRRRALDSFRSDRVAMTESRSRTSAPLRSGTQVSGGSDSRSSSLASTRAWRATCSGPTRTRLPERGPQPIGHGAPHVGTEGIAGEQLRHVEQLQRAVACRKLGVGRIDACLFEEGGSMSTIPAGARPSDRRSSTRRPALQVAAFSVTGSGDHGSVSPAIAK
jgi:hypothetical protein